MSNDFNFKLVRDADVEIITSRDSKNHPVAIARINDEFEHRFQANSRISRALDMMSEKDLAERLSGGHYFFIDDELVDFRDGHYNGFVHSDESILRLFDVIGFDKVQKNRKRDNTTSNSIMLSNIWSSHDIVIPEYKSGGDFSSELSFTWNPFMKDIHSSFKLVRLICTNGMTGLTSFLNTRVPLVNRWEEHLEIASRQIQNKVEDKVAARLREMGGERATVAECMQIADHVNDRLQNGNYANTSERDRLRNVSKVVAPQLHCGDVYKGNVFQDRRLGAQLPAHLSTFDAYNIITEVSTHTDETSGSSNHALDKMANALVFDRQDLSQHAKRYDHNIDSPFSDPETAFFGDIKE